MMPRRTNYTITAILLVLAAIANGCTGSGTTESSPTASSEQALQESSLATGAPPVTSSSPARNRGGTTKPKGDKYVAGQLIVKFKSNDQVGLTHDASTCLAEGRSFAHATADHSASLDALVRRHGISRASGLIRNREGLTHVEARAKLHHRAKGAKFGRARSIATPLEALLNIYRLDLPATADLDAVMADLRNDPHVEYVHPNYTASISYTPNDPYLASFGSWGQNTMDLWNLKLINAEQAWDVSRGSGVVVAVVDTGVDATHPDLVDNIWTNPDEIPDNGIDDDGNGFVDDVHGWDFIGNDNSPNDQVGHGTHIAGTIAAKDNNNLGVVGVAPNAKVMPVQSFSGRVIADSFSLSQGILYAAQNGADIINNSWSMCEGGCPSVAVVEDAVRAAHAAGSVVVFAAGNDNDDIRGHNPVNLPEAVVVAASTPADGKALFSNYGLIDVAAPGSGDPFDTTIDTSKYGILSTMAADCSRPFICADAYVVGDHYVRLGGTSFAAPHVSGAAALILAQHPTYTQEQVRQVLRRGSVDVNGNGYDPEFGYGRIDLAHFAVEPTPLEALIQAPLHVASSQIPLNGSASGDQFHHYIVDYSAGFTPSTWTTIANSNVPVHAGALATWNMATQPDGDYTLRLRAYKSDGSVYEDRHQVTLDRIAITSPTQTKTVRGEDISILGVASPGTFRSYNVRVEVLETGAPFAANLTIPNGGQSPVTNGVLAVWRASTIPAGHYRIVLDVTHQNGSVTSEKVIVIVDPRLHTGWPVDLTFTNERISAPQEHVSMVDLNGDGQLELLAGWGDKVTVLKGDGTPLAGWPQSVSEPGIDWYSISSMPVAGDLDGDGKKEVVAANNVGNVFVWGPNGVVKSGWPRSVASGTVSLTLADVDRNGTLDIVASDRETGVHVLNAGGGYLPGWPASLGTGVTGPATVADLNRDGRNEVVVGIEDAPARLVVLSSTGVVQSGWPQPLNDTGTDSRGSFPVVGDLDDDGDLEVVAVASTWGDDSTARVKIFHHTGQVMSSWAPSGILLTPPVLADLDGDGSLEILSSTKRSDETGALYAWDRQGRTLPGWPKSSPTSPVYAEIAYNTPIVVDLDGDGRSEVIASRLPEYWSTDLEYAYGYPVQAFRYDGTPIPDLARPAYGNWPYAPASPGVADLDGDGRLELVWTEYRSQTASGETPWPRLFAWDLTTPVANAQPWPMYRADARHSGVAQSVVPFVKLTRRNETRRTTGLARYIIRSGSGGVIQIRHPWQAAVKYAVGSELPKSTTLGWGEQFTVPPNQDIKLRIITTTATDVTIDWW